MKKLIALTLVATTVAAIITAKKSLFQVAFIGENDMIVTDSNGKLHHWTIHKKNRNHYVLKQGNRAVIIPSDVRLGDKVKLYSIF